MTLVMLTVEQLLLAELLASRSCDELRDGPNHRQAVAAYQRAQAYRAEICYRVRVSIEVNA